MASSSSPSRITPGSNSIGIAVAGRVVGVIVPIEDYPWLEPCRRPGRLPICCVIVPIEDYPWLELLGR